MRLQWKVFSAAPHRMLFLGGMIQLILTVALWEAELIGRFTVSLWLPLQTVISSTWAHAFIMLYGLFPFFIFGFLMTTYPRWMGKKPIPYQHYTSAFFLFFSASVLFYIGLFLSLNLLIISVFLFFSAWSFSLYVLLRVYLEKHPQLSSTAFVVVNQQYYEGALNIAISMACLGALSFLIGIVSNNAFFISTALLGGVWLYLIPVITIVTHRMLPFFSNRDVPSYKTTQPTWTLPAVAICVFLHIIFEMTNLLAWRWIADMPLMIIVFYHTIHWHFLRSLQVRLVAALHIAFLWLSIALVLYNIQSITLLFSHQHILGKAPLHAVTIGFALSMVIGMATRVVLGHSGRKLAMDGFTWLCFLSISFATVLRIFAELPLPVKSVHFNLSSALILLIFLSAWVTRYLPMILLPRVDGQAG
jgi:uncharacterized protein involved in response to NO